MAMNMSLTNENEEDKAYGVKEYQIDGDINGPRVGKI